jgi:hypothetical protein
VVRIPFEALYPLLAVVLQQLIVLQRHFPEVDRAIQTIRYVGVREHFLVELVDNVEKRHVLETNGISDLLSEEDWDEMRKDFAAQRVVSSS